MVNVRDSGPFDYVRYVLSALILSLSITVTVYAIWFQKTGFFPEVPGWGALILFVAVLFWLGVVEGLQLALVELKRQKPETYKDMFPRAYRLGEIASREDNIEKFLMGRQVIVVFLVFFAAKLTSITASEEDFLFPVPKWFSQVFLETGLLASIVVVIIAQLTPQIISALYPVQFMELILMRPVYYICIGLEFTGLTHICWLLAHGLSMMFRMTKEKEGSPMLEVPWFSPTNPGYVGDEKDVVKKQFDINKNPTQPVMCENCRKVLANPALNTDSKGIV